MSNYLYENQDFETDQGMYTTTPMERLINATKDMPGAGQDCPKCGSFQKLFFGDPNGEHWCAACQIIKDHNLEVEE